MNLAIFKETKHLRSTLNEKIGLFFYIQILKNKHAKWNFIIFIKKKKKKLIILLNFKVATIVINLLNINFYINVKQLVDRVRR